MTIAYEDAPIMKQPLDDSNLSEYQEQYGVRFVSATNEQLADFGRTCDKLQEARLSLNGLCTNLGIINDRRAVVYEPVAFLATAPTAEQIAAINHTETPAVAQFCVDVQAQLAKVTINESRERMVHLPTVLAGADVAATFSNVPFHAACGEWAGKQREFWARKGFADRLVIMGRLLEAAGTQLHFEDAFRPVGVQEGLFKRRVEWTKRDHPEWNDEKIITEAQSKTAVKPRLASHKGGAAVDARLRDSQTGELLDFGHNYPDGGALVFPQTPFVTAEQWRNRQLFQVAAGLSDLTLYVGEDWHVSYGDNLASLDEHGRVRPDYVAKYGPIKDFDHTTGAVTTIYGKAEADQVFAH